ncbi:MAG: carboxymuconolactone decarboxylase family protein [Desulfomonile tiedjei]|nr:carboxymuconolactone decarboxylase family protein [Desulfomonile tiedjei]
MSGENRERYERGLVALKALDPEGIQAVLDSLKEIAPEMSRFLVEFAYGDIYTRPGLDRKSRQVATVAALTALGHSAPQLRFHIGAALTAGLTPDEIIEVMYVTTVFAGFPSGLNGISAAREVFQAKGVSPSLGGTRTGASGTRRDRGLAALSRTSKDAGERVIRSLADIAPDMAYFIIEFSYGDVISRNIISPQHKEIAMIAVCVAKGTMEPQMKVHIHAALNVGCTQQEIVELMMHMVIYAGFPAALNGLTAARQVFEEIHARTGAE